MGAESHEALHLYNSAQTMLEHAAEVQKEEIAQGEAFLQEIIAAIVN